MPGHGYPIPNSDGAPDSGQPATPGKGHLPDGKPGGEIVITRAEAKALVALETDETNGHVRARHESGLQPDQITRLRARSDRARSQGYTLRTADGSAVFKPKNYTPDSDEPTLAGKSQKEKDAAKKAARAEGTAQRAGAKPAAKAAPSKKQTTREAGCGPACGCKGCKDRYRRG